jgi:predicted ATPase
MYIEKILLQNVKCFEELDIDFLQSPGNPRKVTIILGNNGIGKSTLLETLAIALGGDKIMVRLGKTRENWLRFKKDRGTIQATLRRGDQDPQKPDQKRFNVEFRVTGEKPFEDQGQYYESFSVTSVPCDDLNKLRRTAYSDFEKGWFACGYGPFRRIAKGISPSSFDDLLDDKTTRFASLFGYEERMISLEDWLVELDRRSRIEQVDQESSNYRTLFNILARATLGVFPSSELLSFLTDIDADEALESAAKHVRATTEGRITIQDNFGNWVPLTQLSDGYLSTIAWIGDFVSRLSSAFPDIKNIFDAEGVVLVDEIESHLHPSWQREIVNKLRNLFPHIQFIFTTHSALIAAGAKAGELYVLQKRDGSVYLESVHDVRGWRADQILTSFAFGLETTRSPDVEKLYAEYDDILTKKYRDEKFDAERLDQLESQINELLPPLGETPAEQEQYRRMQAYIDKSLYEGGIEQYRRMQAYIDKSLYEGGIDDKS